MNLEKTLADASRHGRFWRPIETPRIQPWQWPNLLALDAALIAVAWQVALADTLGLALPMAACVVLALSVWLTYMADRLFDVARRPAGRLLSARHSFAKRHARVLWRIWAGVLVLDLAIAFVGLRAVGLQKGFLLLLLCLIYTALNQKLSRRFFPKEAFVALIYTGGVVVFQQAPIPTAFAWFFALLCLFNCLIIGVKEKSIDAKMQVHSIAPVVAERWLGAGAFFLHLLVILVAPPGAIAMSTGFLALGVLHILRSRIKVESFRVLADMSLLMPPVVWLLV